MSPLHFFYIRNQYIWHHL